MNDRLTDEQFTELERAIPYSYEAGDYPEDLSDWAREWIGPDGGTLSLLNELRAERARIAAVLALHRPAKAHPICQQDDCPCGGYECCEHCNEYSARGVPWPCDTYKAITEENPHA